MKNFWHKIWWTKGYQWSKNDEKGFSESHSIERKRFKWVGPITGWKDDELMRELTGRFYWRWGFYLDTCFKILA